MYDAFRKMIADLFNNQNMIEFCYINGMKTKCIVSTLDGGMMFADSGMQDLQNFTLDIQLSEQSYNNPPDQNDRILFRNKEYKISHIEYDSTLSTAKLYIVTNSRGK